MSYRWNILPGILAAAFAEKPDQPLPFWASKNVSFTRKQSPKPGPYNVDDYIWTWEFQEILRTRHLWEATLDDGAVVIVDPGTPGARVTPVYQIDVMKSSRSGYTEAVLNLIRWLAAHDPQNIIFAIDNRIQAGEVNEIRLQPTLRQLGQKIFTDNDDDAGKFLLKLRRMLVYFLGSYSSGAFAQKMCELGINDELEEHGTPDSVDDLKSRLQGARHGLLVNLSKPQNLTRNNEGKITGGPIALEHSNGSCHVREIPCPHCGGYQELLQDNMKFGHCKNERDEWDLERVLRETYFECIHCGKSIEERAKRWFNDRTRARWRRTNFEKAEPNHVSMQISDFFGYDDQILWGRLAIEYIKSQGDFVKRKTYRNHHEGLPFEIRESKTEISDLLLLRGPYKRGTLPWLPQAIILDGDVGLTYVKCGVYAFRSSPENGEGECAAIDWFTDLHPDDVVKRMSTMRYHCPETGQDYPISLGVMDAKYRKIEVHKACLRLPRKLYPSAGLRAGISMRSISFNRVPMRPRWFGIIVYNDDDAKGELYTDRIGAWVDWLRGGQHEDERPYSSRLWFPEDVQATEDGRKFLEHHTREHLVERPDGKYEWRRKGDNEWGDTSKVACVTWRFFTLGELGQSPASAADEAAAIAEAISSGE